MTALLTGCATSGSSQLAPSDGGATGQRPPTPGRSRAVDLSQTLVVPRSVQPNFRRRVGDERIVQPNCCALQKTLFISDSFGGSSFTGALYMFDYVKGTALGQVAAPPEGFTEVQGGCSDDNGNVYFANTGMSTVDEFNHSGTYVATLQDPGQFPVGCSYDRSSGDLAVSNIIDTSGGPGSFSIFKNGVLQRTYYPPNLERVYFLAYEGKTGVLWIDGSNSSGLFAFDKFSDGTFTQVVLHGATIGFPGGLQWSAQTKTMVLGDQDTFSAPTFYWVDDDGNVVGRTVLQCDQTSDFCDIVQATIKGSGIVGPDAIDLGAARFPFSAGGAPVLEYSAPFVQPVGSAVSPNKK